MDNDEIELQVGLTHTQQCSYLKHKQERLAVIFEPKYHSILEYEAFIQAGFRRNGDMLYRPNCPACKACESLRVDIANFVPSKSQKKQLKQLSTLDFQIKKSLDENWFELYTRYIEQRHYDGSMYPANKENFLSFVQAPWGNTQFLHLYQNNELIAVAVTDVLSQGLSAIYTFFAPEHSWSLGTLCVLSQILLAKEQNLAWLYLGFQIDECKAMNYKQKFKPHQRYRNNQWTPQQ